ncbi:MAG: sigma 54-interacting transcriptional regulator [Syntrophales bacterium]|nr:sigma 54-interacting transcriptional regulator [Syntrophales bacterium]
MTSTIWRPLRLGTPGRKEISIHNFEELAALHTVARILAQPGELRDQIEQALQEMSVRLGMQRGMISLLDRETGAAWLDVAHGVDIQGMDVTYLPGEGITGKVAQTGRPMALANLGKDVQFLDRTGARRNLNRSELAFLCVPIIYDNRVVGVLSADKVARQVENLDRELAMLSSVAELLAKAVHNRAVEEENRRLRHLLGRSRTPSADIIGHSGVMKNLFGMIAQVADSNTTVLIHGETGTGKELVAHAIHKNSPRLRGPLVQVNCAAIPDTLLESELFGHERGAFTGALHHRRGRFEEANGGTIFLDEVGELSAAAQVKLLRVLQEKQFQPLGSARVVRVDVRIVAATNRNLEQDLASGRFRADLFYRLNVFPLCLPPLRERGSDIILLADHFVLKYTRGMGKPVKKISPAVSDILLAYHWPGNVRELENCIERAILLAPGDTIEPMHLPPSLQLRLKNSETKERGRLNAVVEAQERELITNALRETRGNQTRAAKLLGTTKRIVQYRIRKMGIDPRPFRTQTRDNPDPDPGKG